jgi:hypothetical protein
LTKIAIAIVAFAGLASSAHAAITSYGNRATWTTAMGGTVITETFENSAIDTYPSPSTFPSGLLAGAIASPGWDLQVEAGDPNLYGLVNTTPAGQNYLRAGGNGTFSGQYSFGMVVDALTTGIGFDISGWQPLDGAGSLTINIYAPFASAPFDTITIPSSTNFAAQFIGITSTVPFWGAEIVIPPVYGTGSDVVAVDDVSFIPTPGSAALLGLAGLAAARRRRG